MDTFIVCFNPCFNGFTSLTITMLNNSTQVAISFNPCFNGFTSLTAYKELQQAVVRNSFNPCFNGFTSLTLIIYHNRLVSILVLMDSLL